MSDHLCPRCGSPNLTWQTGWSAGCEWGQSVCEECGHRWGDGLPDSQEAPLPEGMGDCAVCEGAGDTLWGIPCRTCQGTGIVAC